MDISTEISAIQAASQGSELRQPLVDALTALNSGTLPAVNSSDAGKILKVGANGWEVGEKSGYMPVPSATKQITENGTYDVTDYASAQIDVTGGGGTFITKTITQNGTYDAIDDNADGYSEVIVNVPSGSAVLANNTNLVKYWCFKNYSSRPSSYWNIASGSSVSFTQGSGLKLNANNSNMYHQVSKSVADLVGIQFTASMLFSNGELVQTTITYANSNGNKLSISKYGVSFMLNQDSASKVAFLVYGKNEDQAPYITAVKFEVGSQQTLAHIENGVYVLNYEPIIEDYFIA